VAFKVDHSVAVKRKYASWVEAFVDYTEGEPSPHLFRRWAGISAVAGVLERRVWINAFKEPLYPNLYVVLVGPPGVGKTVVTSIVQALWGEVAEGHVAPSSLSGASLLDALRDAERKIVRPQDTPSIITYHSLLIAANELSVLIPAYDPDFLGKLTDLYDCKRFAERKRGKELHYVLPAPQFNLIAATTPSYLNDLLPEGAWDQGFISRVILAYSGDNTKKQLFKLQSENDGRLRDLAEELKKITTLYGKMTFTEGTVRLIQQWADHDGPPRTHHPKLAHYSSRRVAHLLKLCMVACAEQTDTLVVEVEHYQTALGWLLEVEAFMPDIFKTMASGGDQKVINDVYYLVETNYLRKQQPTTKAALIKALAGRVPGHSILRLIDVMVQGDVLQEVMDAKLGKVYIPRPKEP
jgi:hypothetical protein